MVKAAQTGFSKGGKKGFQRKTRHTDAGDIEKKKRDLGCLKEGRGQTKEKDKTKTEKVGRKIYTKPHTV